MTDNEDRIVIQHGADFDGQLVGFQTVDYRAPRAGEFFTGGAGNVFKAVQDYSHTGFHILEMTPEFFTGRDDEELELIEGPELELFELDMQLTSSCVETTVTVLGVELTLAECIELRAMLNALPLDDMHEVA